jgi:DNA gyrase inhibitor GyrI
MQRSAIPAVLPSVLAALFAPLAANYCLAEPARTTVDAVLDKAEQALGGRSMLAGVEAIRIRSHGLWEMPSRQIPPTPFEVELVFQRPDHVRLLWKFPEEMGGEFRFGHDGQDAWGQFGAPPARCQGWHRQVVLQLVAEPQLYLIAPARAEHGDAFALAAEDNGLVHLVYRPLADSDTWHVWFDRDAGHLVRLEHTSYQMDGQRALFRGVRSVPKDFAGLIYPSRSKFESMRDGKVIEAGEETIDSIELNPKLPDDFFSRPGWDVDATTIAVKDMAEETVVQFEHRGPFEDIGKSLAAAMDVILAAGLVPIGAASGAYLTDPKSTAPQDLRADLAVRVANLRAEAPSLPAGYSLTTLPARRVAYAYHRGSYTGETEAHERLRTWMAQQGLLPAGPPRVIWFHDPEVTVEDDLVTEIQVPLQDAPTPTNKRGAFNPQPLDHPWPRWMVGQWTGAGESDAGAGRGTMRAELTLNGQFLMITAEAHVEAISAEQEQFLKTQLHATAEEIARFRSVPFRGIELYTVDQPTDEVVGYMFDSLRCIATGRGQWSDKELVMNWQWSSGHTSTRTTARLSDDKFIAVERIAMPDGSVMEEKGEMIRTK